MREVKRLNRVFVIFAVSALIFFLWIFYGFTGSGRKWHLHSVWALESEERVEEGDLVHAIELPLEFQNSQTILFKSTHTIVEVKLGDSLLYEYGKEENAPRFMKSPGSLWHLVTVPEGSGGKRLEVRICPVYEGYYGNTAEFVFGTRDACVMELLWSFLPELIINCIILLVGMLCIYIHLVMFRKRKAEERSSFLSVGFFSLMIAAWSLCQCGALQFLIPDGRTLYFVDLFSFYLFPIPFNLFVYDITRTKYRRGLLWMARAYLLNMVLAVALQCAGIIDIFSTLPVTHVLMFVNMAYVLLLIHRESGKYKNEDARKFRLPLYTALAFGFAELIMYYIHGLQNTSAFLPVGTFMFILMLIWNQIVRYGKEVEEEKLAYFKKLANMDMLTQALNRNAYEDTMKYLEKQKIEFQTMGMILIDVNEMKYINDNFGHEKGDEAIKLCYQCIRQVFGESGNCFRIGGDEFACVFNVNEKTDIEKEIREFEKLVEKTAGKLQYPFSVAVGYAQYEEGLDTDFKDIVRRSDAMMYRRKRRDKLLKASEQEEVIHNGNAGFTEQNIGENIFKLKKYREVSVEELCEFIDLMTPSTDDYLYVLDFRADFFYVAPHALQRFFLETNAFHHVTENLQKFVYKEDFALLDVEIRDILSSERCMHNMQYRWLDRHNQPVWINCRGYVVRDDDGKGLYMVGCINEIGKKQKADNISGLLGESSLREYLESMKPDFPDGYLLRLGFDDFKEINEKFGMEYGDMIIREAAVCISQCISKEQRLYKMVADEFLVLDFAGGSQEDGLLLFDRIRESLAQFVEDNRFDVVFTVSGGLLTCSSMGEHSYGNATKLTEFSLSEAKKQGKNRCYVFCREEYDAFRRRKRLARTLRRSINHGFEGFSVDYQPLFRADDHSILGAEALMRFQSQEWGKAAPCEFIPILEETGLIIPAGRWVLGEALSKCREIRKKIPDFHVSVNVSHVQVSKTNLLGEIVSALKEAGVPTSALIVELTESGLLEANQNATRFWTDLDNLGIKLALDDFGTGYSNFHYLSELKPDIIKIDRTFVANALRNEEEYYLLSLLCSMTRKLGLKLCLEGVENEEEWKRIQLLVPDYSQGYYWGKPCSYDDFRKKFVDSVE